MNSPAAKFQRSKLLKLKFRKSNDPVTYDSIVVVHNGKKHSHSNYGMMAVIGVNKQKPVEIAAYADDINWDLRMAILSLTASWDKVPLRTECSHPGVVLHFWSNQYRFHISHPLSSLTIFLVKK
jgi:hypothetical protein